MKEKVIQIIADECDIPIDTITLQSTFVALGLDSLEYICLIQRMREDIGPVSEDAAIEAQNVQQLIEALEK